MRHKYEMARYTSKPEYRQALQELIKFEIQALVSSLSSEELFSNYCFI